MEYSIDSALTNLHCITPTDPSGEDEPYLWVFFVTVDGNTVRQRVGDLHHLTANISVHSGSGRPGNLGAPSTVSGGNIHITPSVGQFGSGIRPIVLDTTEGGVMRRLFIPGTIAITSVVIDEDSAPRDAMEEAFNDVKTNIQNRFNDFINGLELDPLLAGAFAAPDPVAVVRRAFAQAVAGLQTTLAQESIAIAIQSAQISAMASTDWWNPFDMAALAIAGLDPDEPVGTARFTIGETDLINASLHRNLDADVRQSTTGLGGAWYRINGYANGSIRFFPGDHEIGLLGAPVREVLNAESERIVRVGRRCVEAGTRIRFTRVGFREKHQVSVNYPFLTYRYFLDGQELTGTAGTVTLTKEVMVPDFDETSFYLIGGHQETRSVVVSYGKSRRIDRPQIERLTLSNNPNDANYDLTLTIEAVLPNGHTIPVCEDGVAIVGQSIEFADRFFEAYVACVAAYLKSLNIQVKPTIPENWKTPELRWERYREVSERLTALQRINLVDAQTIDMTKAVIAKRLRLAVEEVELRTPEGLGE
jgi:hypothetical protein